MKATIFIAAGAAAFLAWLFIKKYQVAESSSMETNPRHADHHLTNVFANAKRHAVAKGA